MGWVWVLVAWVGAAFILGPVIGRWIKVNSR